MTKDTIDDALEKCHKYGVRNILALRGDPPKGEEKWTACDGGFLNACDLVKYIRGKYNDHFCIGVAGYPETHLEAESPEKDIEYLKYKVDCGADLIITQLFYDNNKFLDFVDWCWEKGINVPIIPGIMPIQSYEGFKRMTVLCKTAVPDEILWGLEPIKDDDAQVKQYGIEVATQMCKELIEKGTKFLHFYTLNLEKSVVDVIHNLKIERK